MISAFLESSTLARATRPAPAAKPPPPPLTAKAPSSATPPPKAGAPTTQNPLLSNAGLIVFSWIVVAFLSWWFLTRNQKQKADKEKAEAAKKALEERRKSELNRTLANGVGSYDGQQSEWINEVIIWLASHNSFPIGLTDLWLNSLNDVAKKLSVPGQNEVLFERAQSIPDPDRCPRLSNIRPHRNANGQLIVNANVRIPKAVLRLIASESVDNHIVVSNYEAEVNDLYGECEARLAYIAEEVYLMSCFSGRPEMRIQLVDVDKPAAFNDNSVDNPKVEGLIRKCIASAVLSINFHEYISAVHNNDAPYQSQQTGGYGNQLDTHKIQNGSYLSPSSKPSNAHPVNRLRFKVVKAQRLNISGDLHPYVHVEMDEPAQKFFTVGASGANPNWNDETEFIINDKSDEVLIEIFGASGPKRKDNDRFLGLAIVGVNELKSSHDNVHHLQLQSRPYQNDRVSGVLTIQTDFYNDSSSSGNPHKPSRHELHEKERRALSQQFMESPLFQSVQTEHLPEGKSPPPSPNITKSGKDLTELVDRPHKEPLSRGGLRGSVRVADQPQELGLQRNWSSDEHQPLIDRSRETSQGVEDERRGRDRSKKSGRKRERSFFEELKDRLTGGKRASKKRARSLDDQNPQLEEAMQSLPPSRDPSQTRQVRRLSRADTGDHHEPSPSPVKKEPTSPSQLILELGEPDHHDKKYYFIPHEILPDLVAIKFLKRGKKLHIHNEHTFVAVKTKGTVTCNVCQRKISSTFMKQAYQCRDCRLVCHKSCHEHTVKTCPTPTISNKFIVQDVDWEEMLSRFRVEEFISGENL